MGKVPPVTGAATGCRFHWVPFQFARSQLRSCKVRWRGGGGSGAEERNGTTDASGLSLKQTRLGAARAARTRTAARQVAAAPRASLAPRCAQLREGQSTQLPCPGLSQMAGPPGLQDPAGPVVATRAGPPKGIGMAASPEPKPALAPLLTEYTCRSVTLTRSAKSSCTPPPRGRPSSRQPGAAGFVLPGVARRVPRWEESASLARRRRAIVVGFNSRERLERRKHRALLPPFLPCREEPGPHVGAKQFVAPHVPIRWCTDASEAMGLAVRIIDRTLLT